MQPIKLSTQCPHCAKDLVVSTNVPNSPMELYPEVRSKVVPARVDFIYRITSDEIKQFIIEKSQKYIPDVKVEVVPRYCEKKRHRDTDPHRSYASLRIAFSDNVIEKKDDLGWYGKIGESTENVRVVESLFKEIISRYQYNRKDIEGWMKSYKTMEELEDALGMNEAYLNDLRMYSTPRRLQTSTKESWIIFSAAAENVIQDMLTEVTSNKVAGGLKIDDVYPISKEVVEFVVRLTPGEQKMRENPHVRQILMGEEKPKK